MSVNFDTVQIGQDLPRLFVPPVYRTMVALFAGASGDHNPIHIYVDFARRSGLPDVFSQGMLGMAWVARLLIQWATQSALRRLEFRSMGITHLGNAMTCGGRVREKLALNGESCVRIELRSCSQFGQTKIVGDAVVALALTSGIA
jgi:acyl dehydratase